MKPTTTKLLGRWLMMMDGRRMDGDRRMKGKEKGKASSVEEARERRPDKEQDECVSVHGLEQVGAVASGNLLSTRRHPQALGSPIPNPNWTSERRSDQWCEPLPAPQGGNRPASDR